VPIDVFFGWSAEAPREGVPVGLGDLTGGRLDLPDGEVLRRHADRAEYLARVRAAGEQLVASGHLFADDLEEVVADAARTANDRFARAECHSP